MSSTYFSDIWLSVYRCTRRSSFDFYCKLCIRADYSSWQFLRTWCCECVTASVGVDVSQILFLGGYFPRSTNKRPRIDTAEDDGARLLEVDRLDRVVAIGAKDRRLEQHQCHCSQSQGIQRIILIFMMMISFIYAQLLVGGIDTTTTTPACQFLSSLFHESINKMGGINHDHFFFFPHQLCSARWWCYYISLLGWFQQPFFFNYIYTR